MLKNLDDQSYREGLRKIFMQRDTFVFPFVFEDHGATLTVTDVSIAIKVPRGYLNYSSLEVMNDFTKRFGILARSFGKHVASCSTRSADIEISIESNILPFKSGNDKAVDLMHILEMFGKVLVKITKGTQASFPEVYNGGFSMTHFGDTVEDCRGILGAAFGTRPDNTRLVQALEIGF
jgi:hypothetical protein